MERWAKMVSNGIFLYSFLLTLKRFLRNLPQTVLLYTYIQSQKQIKLKDRIGQSWSKDLLALH